MMTWRDGMERGGRETQEGGAYVHLPLTHFIVQQRLAKCGRATILQLKKKVLILLLKQRKDSLLVTWGCQECLEE